jgi:hypothetical protein
MAVQISDALSIGESVSAILEWSGDGAVQVSDDVSVAEAKSIIRFTFPADWPSIAAPTFGTTVEVYKPQIRTEFDGNYVQSRPRMTREIRRWVLKWNVMTEADYQTLAAFFVSNQGNSFNWTESVTSTSYLCRFSANSLSSVHVSRGATYYRSVEVMIEEV